MSARPPLLAGVFTDGDVPALVATLEATEPACRPGDELVVLPDGARAESLAASAGQGALRSRRSLPGTGGRPAAFNRLAAAVTDERAMLFLEAGVRLAADAVDRLAAAVVQPRIGVAGPSLNDAWGPQRIEFSGPLRGIDPADTATVAALLATRHGDAVASLAPLHGIAECCLAVGPAAMRAVGAADEGFGSGPCWEMEYAARAWRAGLPAVWVRAAYAHWRPPSTQRATEVEREFRAARERYQDRLCGLRLSGARSTYCDHCAGQECDHFAPQKRIVVHLAVRATAATPTRDVTTVESQDEQSEHRGRAIGTGSLHRSDDLVSCVMPTADRPEWVARSIEQFRRQDHPAKELIVVDDGAEDLGRTIGDLLHGPAITHVRLDQRASIGAKRNLGAQRANGSIVMQWDDDDWYGVRRISRQVEPILTGRAELTGLSGAVWFDVDEWRFRAPHDDTHRQLFVEDVHGGTLAYARRVWSSDRVRYPDVSLAEDAWFVRQAVRDGHRLERLPAAGVYLYVRHRGNSWTVPDELLRDELWDDVHEPLELGDDRDFYAARSPTAGSPPCHDRPLVSCIMPTANRAPFVPGAIDRFLAQNYERCELIVLDDGRVPVDHLVPSDPRVRYIRMGAGLALGEKRNRAIEASRGEVIVHMDDDDWSHPDRLAVQVDTLAAGGDVCGLDRMLWWDPERREAWRYTRPELHRPWVAGNTLAYLRSTWQRAPFPAQDVGEDTAFVWGLPDRKVVPISDERLVVGRLHSANTSTKQTANSAWTRADVAEVERVLASAMIGSTPC